MAGRFRVTYDIVTPESAEHGDIAEGGFITPGEWRFPATGPDDVSMSLRDAVRLLSGGMEDSGRWFTESYPERRNYQTGAEETRALHPPRNITPASYRRLARLLGASR